MDPMTLAVAGVAAAAIFLIAIGHCDVRQRFRRSTPASSATPPARTDGEPPAAPAASREMIAKSVALAPLNRVVEKRDFGANLARDIARADLKLKPSASSWRSGPASIIGVPAPDDRLLGSASRHCATPIALLVGIVLGFFLPRFWLGRRKSGRLNAFNKQLPDTITLLANALRAGSSFLQAIELVVRESRPPSRPSSVASSAKSTSACRSSRRSRTWSAASGPTTSS